MPGEVKPLPCPFCGSNDLFDAYRHIRCESCGAEGPYDEHGGIAGEGWNRRTPLFNDESLTIAHMMGFADGKDAAKDPGASVIRWTRYDGTPETEPEEGRSVICFYEGRHVTFSHGYAVGALWTYLPQPPEGMG